MHYQPLAEEDRAEMLKEIGVGSFDELIQNVPSQLRNSKLTLPEGLSEAEIQAMFNSAGFRNQSTSSFLSFLGGGSYEHFIPSAVSSITGRHEFYTAYTPYQPEASQGSLQAIYEFQSLMTELTGLDVSNASHYDGATSLAEACLLACRQTGRYRILVAKTIHPHYRQVLNTYFEASSYTIEEIAELENGEFDRKSLESSLNDEIAAVVFQTPNFLGTIENLEGVAESVHDAGALLITSVNPISLGVLRAPGEWGVDIAVGEGQPLGIPQGFGGPYLGFFVVNRALMRKVPGRLAGLTVDSDGRRAFCLTLQAREQHIRREKATSNICTNQALCALAATVYMTLLGKKGIIEIGEINLDRAAYLRNEIKKLDQFEVLEGQSFFNEFVVQYKGDLQALLETLNDKKIFPGISLERYFPNRAGQLLICATETKSKADLDRFVKELSQC